MFRRLLLLILVTGTASSLVAALFIGWGYYYFTRDLPRLTRIEDYKPPAVTRVYASDGTLIAEFLSERRYPAKLSEVPDYVRKAFLAAEDASFYSHSGIDPMSILRAMYKNLQTGNVRQGGSTITQQVVKNLLLSSEQVLDRKIKEAILSYRLEKRFSKDEIFEIYLNHIFFGNTAYGIKAAAKMYFHKELSELTIAEGAALAGLPKAPSEYSPLRNMRAAKARQGYVLRQMVKVGFITEDQRKKAQQEPLVVYPATQQNIQASPYYVGEVRRVFATKWKDLDLDSDGLQVETAVDVVADSIAQKALQKGLREVDKRRGWRGPIGVIDEAQYRLRYEHSIPTKLEPDIPYPALVLSIAPRGQTKVRVGKETFPVNLDESTWARRFREPDDSVRGGNPADLIKVGSLIEVSLRAAAPSTPNQKSVSEEPSYRMVLDQTPDIEGGLVLIDPKWGYVRAMIGGYNYAQSQFNRVTQSLRQPGSTFKPLVYLSAVDKFKYTPSTIVHDTPRTFRVGDTFWTPANFDKNFLGPITLRTALEKSRNLVSADIVSRIGVDAPIEYARLLGITSPLGRNLSLSLGSSEVTILELTRAYGVFANKGVLQDSVFVTKIKDRFGNVLYDYENEKLGTGKQVITTESAFIMANMMKGVVEYGTGYKIKELGRPVAGKTGTSNDQMDAWFVGYTPEWVCGVWVGFDQKKQIGPKETGGVVSAPIWLYAMRQFLEHRKSLGGAKIEAEAKEEAERLGIEYTAPEVTETLDFPIPDGVEPFWIDKSSGLRVAQGAGAFLEYFVRGTEPEAYRPPEESSADGEASESSYLESPDL
jgi:penicillin-binding protein 1A